MTVGTSPEASALPALPAFAGFPSASAACSRAAFTDGASIPCSRAALTDGASTGGLAPGEEAAPARDFPAGDFPDGAAASGCDPGAGAAPCGLDCDFPGGDAPCG